MVNCAVFSGESRPNWPMTCSIIDLRRACGCVFNGLSKQIAYIFLLVSIFNFFIFIFWYLTSHKF